MPARGRCLKLHLRAAFSKERVDVLTKGQASKEEDTCFSLVHLVCKIGVPTGEKKAGQETY